VLPDYQERKGWMEKKKVCWKGWGAVFVVETWMKKGEGLTEGVW